jgi:hypothetical protein
MHLYCSAAHQSCGENIADFLVLPARVAEESWPCARHIKNLQQGLHLLLPRATEKPYFDTEIG